MRWTHMEEIYDWRERRVSADECIEREIAAHDDPSDDDHRSFDEKYVRTVNKQGVVIYRYVPRSIPGAVVTEIEVTVGPKDED